MHKTARNPIVIKGNAMAIANAVELEGCRMSERTTIKKAPRLIMNCAPNLQRTPFPERQKK